MLCGLAKLSSGINTCKDQMLWIRTPKRHQTLVSIWCSLSSHFRSSPYFFKTTSVLHHSLSSYYSYDLFLDLMVRLDDMWPLRISWLYVIVWSDLVYFTSDFLFILLSPGKLKLPCRRWAGSAWFGAKDDEKTSPHMQPQKEAADDRKSLGLLRVSSSREQILQAGTFVIKGNLVFQAAGTLDDIHYSFRTLCLFNCLQEP